MPESTPLQFDIPSMSCNSCVEAVTKAVHKVDSDASVTADLATKRVVIGGQGAPQDFIRAIQEAGFDVKAAE